jgi:hypothetical protein
VTTYGSDGSVFLAGRFVGPVDFDPTAAQDIHAPVGVVNTSFITKFNADGSYAWTRSFSAPDVSLDGLAAAAGGAVVAVGQFLFSVDLDPGPGVDLHYASDNPAAGRQGLVVKLATDGSLVWGRTFYEGTTDRSYSTGIAAAVDATDAVYVAGLFTRIVDFDPGPGTALRTAPYVSDAMLVKLTPAGEFSWVQTIGAGVYCSTNFSGVAVATDGKIWAVGSIGFGPFCEGMPSGGGPVIQPLITAYGPAGDMRGVWKPTPVQYAASAGVVAAGASGSVYVGGIASGLIDLDPGQGVAMHWAGPPEGGGFVVQLGPDAGLLWAVASPGVWVNGLARTGDGGVLAVGSRRVAFADQLPTAVVTKLGPGGIPGWTFATGGLDGSADTVAARGSGFVVAGGNRGTGDFDPGAGMQTIDGDVRFLSRFTF